jgi:ABC-type transporter Mla maintaining outer membrane lipid asymmetry ATPase subunit MlaF
VSQAAVQIAGLWLRRDAQTLEDVSMRVDWGESVALLGDDQESLSLLLRACAGLEVPDRGTIHVAGVDVTSASRRALLELRAQAGYVSGEGAAFSNMSLLANVALPLRYHTDEPEAEIERRALALLAEVGLAEEAHERAAAVPPALRKRAAYARALARDPRILIVEDPSALLDPEGRAALETLHARLRADGVTVLLADDDVDFCARLARRAVVLQGGRIGWDGPIEALPPAVRMMWRASGVAGTGASASANASAGAAGAAAPGAAADRTAGR